MIGGCHVERNIKYRCIFNLACIFLHFLWPMMFSCLTLFCNTQWIQLNNFLQTENIVLFLKYSCDTIQCIQIWIPVSNIHTLKKSVQITLNSQCCSFVCVTLHIALFYRSLTFIYPFGATLNVAKPAVAVLSSGSVSFPLNRPICAMCKSKVTSSYSTDAYIKVNSRVLVALPSIYFVEYCCYPLSLCSSCYSFPMWF